MLLDVGDAVSHFLLATRSADEVCSGCLAVSPRWWSTWCQGKNTPSTGHGSPLADQDSHEQRRTYVLPGGRLKRLHKVVADSS